MVQKRGGTGRRAAPKALAKVSRGSVKSFLVALATDPARLGAFIKDPDGELKAAGIGDNEAAILRSGNAGAIYGLLSGQAIAQPQPPVTVLIVDVEEALGEGEDPKFTIRGLGTAGAQPTFGQFPTYVASPYAPYIPHFAPAPASQPQAFVVAPPIVIHPPITVHPPPPPIVIHPPVTVKK